MVTNPAGTKSPESSGRESEEREAARKRAELRAAHRMAASEPSGGAKPLLAGHPVAIRLFAALAENVRDYAIFLLDPDGVITYWGEAARLMKWWTREEAEGSHLRMLYPDGGAEDGTAEEHVQQAAERGEYSGEGTRIRAGGSTFWAGISLTALRDADGTLLGFAKVSRDLTARHATEQALRAARDSVETLRRDEEANRQRSEFLATLSHEIRTPVNAIIGYADLLELGTGGGLTEGQRSQVERIRSSGRHLLGLVNDSLDLFRAEAEKMPLVVDSARVGVVVDSALELVEPQARTKELEICNEVSGAAAKIVYCGDEDRVRQILVNVLANAVKFTPSGGRVTVSAGTATQASPDAKLDGDGPWSWIRIEDKGPGIPADRLKTIFEPFEQVEKAHQFEGSGLGITISLRLARLMSGDITVRSELGSGSSFFLWLPAATKP